MTAERKTKNRKNNWFKTKLSYMCSKSTITHPKINIGNKNYTSRNKHKTISSKTNHDKQPVTLCIIRVVNIILLIYTEAKIL